MEQEIIDIKRIRRRGPFAHVTKISFEIKTSHYAFLEAFAAQFNTTVPQAIEMIIERVFIRDFVKFKTITEHLLRRGMGISDLIAYLKLGERNEERIWFLFNKSRETNKQGLENKGQTET